MHKVLPRFLSALRKGGPGDANKKAGEHRPGRYFPGKRPRQRPGPAVQRQGPPYEATAAAWVSLRKYWSWAC